MSENRKININPNDFSMKNTRKKCDKTATKSAIRVKSSAKPKSNETIKRKSILKMIRNHHEDRNKQKVDKDLVNNNSTEQLNEFNQEFKDAQIFFENLSIQNKNKIKPSNYTLKNNHIPTNSLLLHPTINSTNPNSTNPNPTNPNPTNPNPTNLIDLSNTMNTPKSTITHINPYANVAKPLYGCLKNGVLPTYRTYQNQTRKQLPNIVDNMTSGFESNAQLPGPMQSGPMQSGPMQSGPMQPTTLSSNTIATNMRSNIMQQQHKLIQPAKRVKHRKQKRVVRRTYKVGKNKLIPKISVLVSNKTIRNRVIEQNQLLKQTSVQDIKQYLIKRGFIRLGTSAPNDVLRQMYENMIMVGAEINNHNSENLLYNFINE